MIQAGPLLVQTRLGKGAPPTNAQTWAGCEEGPWHHEVLTTGYGQIRVGRCAFPLRATGFPDHLNSFNQSKVSPKFFHHTQSPLKLCQQSNVASGCPLEQCRDKTSPSESPVGHPCSKQKPFGGKWPPGSSCRYPYEDLAYITVYDTMCIIYSYSPTWLQLSLSLIQQGTNDIMVQEQSRMQLGLHHQSLCPWLVQGL